MRAIAIAIAIAALWLTCCACAAPEPEWRRPGVPVPSVTDHAFGSWVDDFYRVGLWVFALPDGSWAEADYGPDLGWDSDWRVYDARGQLRANGRVGVRGLSFGGPVSVGTWVYRSSSGRRCAVVVYAGENIARERVIDARYWNEGGELVDRSQIAPLFDWSSFWVEAPVSRRDPNYVGQRGYVERRD